MEKTKSISKHLPDWLKNLIEDLRDILTESVFEMRARVIETKWHIGDRLLQEEGKLTKEVVQRVALELKVSERDLQYCLAFRRKFPSLQEMWSRLPEGKNISWHKLINEYIDFEIPKPIPHIEEKIDEWGLTDWWKEQDNLQILRIKSKSDDFALIVRKAKVSKEEKDKFKVPLQRQLQELCDYYIELKGWDKSTLVRSDYGRIFKALKVLLEKAKYDSQKVKDIMFWVAKQKYPDWTLETCIKKYADAFRKI
jgi:hypothetical protein